MNGYEKRTEQKKELILVTAQKMFFHNGIANTNIVDIAKEANVSKVTIFNYFGSKEALAREVMKRYINSIVSIGRNILSEQIPFSEKMKKLFSMGENNRSLFGKDVFSKKSWEDPYLQELYREESSSVMPIIMTFFEQGKNEGIIDSSIPSEALLAYISAIAPLLNPGKFNINSDYVIGMHKLFYYGLFGNNSTFDKMTKNQVK